MEKFSKNPRYSDALVTAKKEICALLEQRRSQIEAGNLVVFLDEYHLLWGDTCGYVWGLFFWTDYLPENNSIKKSEQVEVSVGNQRSRKTYFGALGYKTKEFLMQAATTGNAENTVAVIKYLQFQRLEQKMLMIWDGASYHKVQQV